MYGPTIFHLMHLFGLFRREALHDAAQKWLPAPRGIPQSVISVTPAGVRVTSRTRRRGALHILTARVVLFRWCVGNAEKITVRTRVNVETRWHRGELNDYADWPNLTVTCASLCVASMRVYMWPSSIKFSAFSVVSADSRVRNVFRRLC
jgi:hypothetical protein